MKRVVLIQNDPKVGKGSIENNSFKIVQLNAWDNPWSQIFSDDYVVVLGGHMGVYDTKQFPYLIKEKHWIKKFVNQNGKFLGICLGAQLLAEAIGGLAFLSANLEFGVKNFKLKTNNDLLNIFQDVPLLTWHRDTFSLPSNTEVLAKTEFPQMFEYKSSIGFQFHPEVTLDLFDTWIDSEGSREELSLHGYKIDDVRDEIALFEDDMSKRMNDFIDAWVFAG